MPARRKSRSPRRSPRRSKGSRSKSPRRVLKRRSSGKARTSRRAAVTRRSPNRRTYKGTRMYGMIDNEPGSKKLKTLHTSENATKGGPFDLPTPGSERSTRLPTHDPHGSVAAFDEHTEVTFEMIQELERRISYKLGGVEGVAPDDSTLKSHLDNITPVSPGQTQEEYRKAYNHRSNLLSALELRSSELAQQLEQSVGDAATEQVAAEDKDPLNYLADVVPESAATSEGGGE